ncbi:hypothetical protein CYMTET_24023, partial [Cymbomonas tetramitiformis]
MLLLLLVLAKFQSSQSLLVDPTQAEYTEYSAAEGTVTDGLRFNNALNFLSGNVSESSLRSAFQLLDFDGDGFVSFTEYAASARRSLEDSPVSSNEITTHNSKVTPAATQPRAKQAGYRQVFPREKLQTPNDSDRKVSVADSFRGQDLFHGAKNQWETHSVTRQVLGDRRLTQTSRDGSPYPEEEEGLTLCMDSPSTWLDKDGDSCQSYGQLGWCTEDGLPGESLLKEELTLEDFEADGLTAADVCCVCGAGIPIFRIGVALDLMEQRSGHTRKGQQMAAVHMAIREINNDSSILPDHRLLFAVQDSGCKEDDGIIAADRLAHDWPVDVVVGATCSSASIGVQKVLGLKDVTQISGYSTSTFLVTPEGSSSEDHYPYFMRTILSAKYEARAMADVVHYYNWTRVVTVAVDDEYGLSGIAAFHEAAEALGILVRAEDRLTYPFGTEDFSDVVERLKAAQAFIFVTFGHSGDTGRLLEQAYAAGVGGEGFVWLGSDASTSTTTWESMSSDLSEEDRNDVMRGYIGVRPFINTTTPEYAAFAERWAAQPATMDAETGECSSEVDDADAPIWRRTIVDDNGTSCEMCIGAASFGNDTSGVPQWYAYFYDAVYVVARALQVLLQIHGDHITREEMKNEMLAQSFVGVTGLVTFDAAGDRSEGVMYEVLNHAGRSTLEPVGIWMFSEAEDLTTSEYHVCHEKMDYLPCSNIVWSTDDNSVPRANYIAVGVAIALGAAMPYSSLYALSAVYLGLQVANSRLSANDFVFRFAVENSNCDALGGKQAAATLLDWGANVVVGTTCSESSQTAADRLEPFDIPQISGGATSTAFSVTNRSNTSIDPYPFFMRTMASSKYEGRAIAGVVHYHGWTRVATIAVDDAYGVSVSQEFYQEAEALGIVVRTQDRFIYPYGTEDFSGMVRELQETRTLIIVLFGHTPDTWHLMEQAYAAGVGGEGYVWLMVDDRLWENMDEDVRDDVLRGHIGVRPFINISSPNFKDFSEKWTAQPATLDAETGKCSSEVDDAGSPIWRRTIVDDSGGSYENCVGLNYTSGDLVDNVYPAHYFDAVHVVMHGLQDLLQSRLDTITGIDLRDAMQRQDFVGATGRVTFDFAGDRTSQYFEVVNILGETKNHVGTWDLGPGGYNPCKIGSEEPDCYAVQWST